MKIDDLERAPVTATEEPHPAVSDPHAIRLPWWGYPITGHTQLETVLSTLPHPGRKLTDTELELIELREDNIRYRQALDTTLRAFRTLTAQVTDLPTQRAQITERAFLLAARETELTTRENQLDDWEKRLDGRQKQLDEQEQQKTTTITIHPTPADLPSPSYWPLQQAAGT